MNSFEVMFKVGSLHCRGELHSLLKLLVALQTQGILWICRMSHELKNIHNNNNYIYLSFNIQIQTYIAIAMKPVPLYDDDVLL